MKIFLFSITDGIGVCSVQLARGLAAKDQVTIALHGPEADELLTEFPDFFQESQFHPLAVPHYGFPDPRKIWQAYHVHRAITRNKPDVLHISLGGLFTEAFPVLWLAHQSGLPMVATVHDPWYHLGDFPPLRHAWLICKVQEWCSQLIVHGWQLAQNLITGMGMDERLINVVPHGNYDIYLQAKWIPPLSVPVPGRVLFFGRMLKYKGLDVLAQAAKLVAGKVPTLKIVLAGRGEELDRLQPQLQSNSHLVWPKLVANAAKRVLRSLLGQKKGFRTSAELLNLMHPFLLADGTRFRSGHRSTIAQISKDKLRRESWDAGDEFDSLLFQRWCSART